MSDLRQTFLERGEALLRRPRNFDVLETMAMAIALQCLDEIRHLPKLQRDAIAKLGRRELLRAPVAPDPPHGDGDEEEDGELGRRLAWAGLAALEGRAPELGTLPRDATHPSARRLVELLAGQLDGFAAACAALHVHGCGACQGAVHVAQDAAPQPVRLRVAAADSAPMRAPQGGLAIGNLDAEGVEVVVFDDPDARRVAVYAREGVPVRLHAGAITTENMLPGYWLGCVNGAGPEATALVGELHLGDRRIAVQFTLPSRVV